MLRRSGLTLGGMLLLCAGAAGAAPRLDPQFTSHAVLQHGRAVTVTGSAAAGERIEVRVGSQAKAVTADRAGRWSTEMAPLRAGQSVRIEARGADEDRSAGQPMAWAKVSIEGLRGLWPLASTRSRRLELRRDLVLAAGEAAPAAV